MKCPAAICLVRDEEPDTPRHALLRYPCLGGVRLMAHSNIFGDLNLASPSIEFL